MTLSPGQPAAAGCAPIEPAVLHAIAAGVRLFDSGAYWHAHEAWEQAWRHERGHDRHYLKGLIQFAAALHHWQRGKRAPAARLLSQAQAHIQHNAGLRWPFATSQVLHSVALTARQLQLGEPAGSPQLHPAYRPVGAYAGR